MMARLLGCVLGVVVIAGAVRAQDPGERAQAAAFIRLLGDEQLSSVAERSLARMGEAAIPALAAGLADANGSVRARNARAGLLAKAGAESDAAKAALGEAVGDRVAAVRVAACLALLELGESGDEVVSGLASALASVDERVRRAAATGLQQAGKEARSAIPMLLKALDDRDAEVARQARAALQAMGVVAIDALGESTRSESPVQRAAAVFALGGLGRDAGKAVPRLVEMLHDDIGRVRVGAAVALGRIGKEAAAAAPELRQLLAAPATEADLKKAAFSALDAIGPDGWDAVAELRRLWRAKDPRVRSFAATGFGRRRVKEAQADMVVGLNDMSHLVRGEAARALARIDPAAPETLLVLTAALQDRFLLSPQAAAVALGEMGAHAADASPLLEQAAQSEDEDIAEAARKALEKIR